MIHICPNCNQRYVVDPHVTDMVHNCNSGNEAIDEEDVVVVGSWEDFSGSATVPPQQVLMQGVENTLFGTLSDIEGDDMNDITRRGVSESTHRQRNKQTYIDLQ